MFLNFWWKDLKSSAEKAKSLGRSPYDLYAGIDVEAKGYDTNVNWDLLFPDGKPAVTSLVFIARTGLLTAQRVWRISSSVRTNSGWVQMGIRETPRAIRLGKGSRTMSSNHPL